MGFDRETVEGQIGDCLRQAICATGLILASLVSGCSSEPAPSPTRERATPPIFLASAATKALAPGTTPTPGLARSVSRAAAANGITAETHSATGWLVSNASTKKSDVDIAIAIPILALTGEGDAVVNSLSRSIVADIIDTTVAAIDPASPGGLDAIALELGSAVEVSVTYYLGYALQGSRRLRPAPHGDSFRRGVNIDRANGRLLSLKDLFMPGSAYLTAISGYCADTFNATGATYARAVIAPTSENYANWVLSPSGLVVFFDGAMLTGQSTDSPQVVVPFSVLKPYLAVNGVADRLARGEP